MRVAMLTTTDNPFDPFDNFDEWLSYDNRLGHGTLSLLGRVGFISEESSEVDQSLAVEAAIDEIVRENVSGLFKKVTREINENEL